MANHKSAIKRARQNEKKRLRNKITKTKIKTVTKSVMTRATEESPEMVSEKLNIAQSIIDKAAQKGVIHHRTAARKISRLSKMVAKTS